MPLNYFKDTDIKWYWPKNKEFAALSTAIREVVCVRISAHPLLAAFPVHTYETHYEILNPDTKISIELWGPGEDVFLDNLYMLPMKDGTPFIIPGTGLCDGPESWRDLLQNPSALERVCEEVSDILKGESPYPY